MRKYYTQVYMVKEKSKKAKLKKLKSMPEEIKMPEKSDHDMLRDIYGVLMGTNGQGGLLRAFEEHKEADMKFRREFYKFKERLIIFLCIGGGGSGLWVLIGKILGG